ncbi:MAG: GerAB/ArcD/ProY family transporter [Bacillota bacterium]
MQEPQEDVSGVQLAVLLATTLIGVRTLTMPREVTEAAGTGGWLSISLAGGLALSILLLSLLMGLRFPGQSPYEYFPIIWGTFIGKALNYLFIIFYAAMVGVNLRIFGDIVKVTILPTTPLEVIIITKLVVIAYLVRHGIAPIARMAEVFLPLIFMPLGGLILLGLGSMHLEQLMPPLSQGIIPALKGVFPAYLSYTGFGVILFLLPYLKKQKIAIRAVTLGMSIPLALFLFTWAVSMAHFGEIEMQFLTYPVLEVAKTVRVPGDFLARYEIILIASWVLATVGIAAPPYFIAVQGIAREMKLKDSTPVVWLLVPMIYLVAIFPPNLPSSSRFAHLMGVGSLGLSGLLIASIAMSMLRGKGGTSGNAG